jgi:hypothetical protein
MATSDQWRLTAPRPPRYAGVRVGVGADAADIMASGAPPPATSTPSRFNANGTLRDEYTPEGTMTDTGRQREAAGFGTLTPQASSLAQPTNPTQPPAGGTETLGAALGGVQTTTPNQVPTQITNSPAPTPTAQAPASVGNSLPPVPPPPFNPQSFLRSLNPGAVTAQSTPAAPNAPTPPAALPNGEIPTVRDRGPSGNTQTYMPPPLDAQQPTNPGNTQTYMPPPPDAQQPIIPSPPPIAPSYSVATDPSAQPYLQEIAQVDPGAAQKLAQSGFPDFNSFMQQYTAWRADQNARNSTGALAPGQMNPQQSANNNALAQAIADGSAMSADIGQYPQDPTVQNLYANWNSAVQQGNPQQAALMLSQIRQRLAVLKEGERAWGMAGANDPTAANTSAAYQYRPTDQYGRPIQEGGYGFGGGSTGNIGGGQDVGVGAEMAAPSVNWLPPGQSSPADNWQYDLQQGWSQPGSQAPQGGSQIGMGGDFDPTMRGGGVQAMMHGPGEQAPVDAVNWTPETGEIHPPGIPAPADKTNYSLVAS